MSDFLSQLLPLLSLVVGVCIFSWYYDRLRDRLEEEQLARQRRFQGQLSAIEKEQLARQRHFQGQLRAIEARLDVTRRVNGELMDRLDRIAQLAAAPPIEGEMSWYLAEVRAPGETSS